jgi:acetylornithine deacetylase
MQYVLFFLLDVHLWLPNDVLNWYLPLTSSCSTSFVVKKLQEYVDDINANLETKLPTRGPVSKYVLPDENLRGRWIILTLLTSTSNRHDRAFSFHYSWLICYSLEIAFDGDIMNGVACNLESRGFKALCKATEEIVGHVEPYSITGSLPLIRELQVWTLTYTFFFLNAICVY